MNRWGALALFALFIAGTATAVALAGTPTLNTYTYTVPGYTVAPQTYVQTVTVPTVTVTVGGTTTAAPTTATTTTTAAPATTRFGMYDNCGLTSNGDTAANWKAIRDKNMPAAVHWRREFNPSLPAVYNGGDTAQGIGTFLSFKSSYLDVASGASKAAIQAYAKTWPQGAYATWEHEPENLSKEFVADPYHRFVLNFEQVYQWVKAVRPDVHFGPVYMAYQWGTSGQAYAKASQWKVPPQYADFYGVDWYNEEWNPVTWNLGTATDFKQWYSVFGSLGKPNWITEFGIKGTTSSAGGKNDTDTATIINASRAWAATHNIAGVLYWNGINSDGGVNDFQLTPCVGDMVGRPKALAAWNAWASG